MRKVLIIGGVVLAALILVAAIVGMSMSLNSSDIIESGVPDEQTNNSASSSDTNAEEWSAPMGVEMPDGSVYGNTPGNISSDGSVNFYDGWVYYASVSDSLNLKRVQVDGSDNESVSDISALSLATYNGWLYYIDMYNNICRARPNGENEEQVTSFKASWLNIVDGWIYVVKSIRSDESSWGGEIWKMRADGSEATLLHEGIWGELLAYDGWLYFTAPKSGEDRQQQMLYRMDYEGNGFQELGVNTYLYTLTQDWIFYCDSSENALYKMAHDGSAIQKVSDADTRGLNALGDWVYYIDRVDETTRLLYRVHADTSERILVTDKSCLDVYVASDKILFTEHHGKFDMIAYASGNEIYLADPDGSNMQLIDRND